MATQRDFDRFNKSREAFTIGGQLGGRRVFVEVGRDGVPVMYLEHASGRLRRPFFRFEPHNTIYDGVYGNKFFERRDVMAALRQGTERFKASSSAESRLFRSDVRRELQKLANRHPEGMKGILSDMVRR